MSLLDPPPSSDVRPARLREWTTVVGAWLLACALTVGFAAATSRAVFMFFWSAVLYAAWRRGFAAAVVGAIGAIGAVVVVERYVLPSTGPLRERLLADAFTLGAFVVASAIVSLLSTRRARSLALALSQAAQLREQADELQQQTLTAQESAQELELTAEQLQLVAAEAESARTEADDARARITAILDGMSDIVVVYDAEWRFTYLNPAAHAMLRGLGEDPDHAVGRVVWELIPVLRDTPFEHETRRAAGEQRSVEFEEYLAPVGRWLESRVVPGRDGTVMTFTRDVTDRRRALAAERTAADRAQRLLTVTTGLSEARTPEEVGDVIFSEGLAAIGADAATLALLRETPDGPHFETVRAHGFDDAVVDVYRRFPLRAGRPLSDALLTRTPRLLASHADWEAQYPEVAAETAALGFAALVAVPVVSGRDTLGGFTASFREPLEIDDGLRTFLATLGEQCGLALARAQAFVAVHEAREFSASILDSVRDGFIALDAELRYTYVNARAEELLHRRADALRGRALGDAFDGDGESPIVDAARRVLATQVPEALEAESTSAGIWLEARLYPAPGGVTGFFQDVTARRRAQESTAFLIEATQLLSASLDFETTLRTLAAAAVPRLGDWCAVDIVVDPMQAAWPPELERLAIVHADPAKIALGVEVAARYPTDWNAPAGMAAVIRDRQPLFLREVSDAIVVAGARDAEHLRLLRALQFSAIIAVPLVARGVTLGALTLCMTESGRRYDEADLRLAEELAQRAAVAVDNARLFREAERSREEAEAANRAKSQFLSTMSHELRTPLNAIAGYTELMEMGVRGPVSTEQREDLARIRRSSKVLMSLVNDVLNFARVEAGQVDVRLQPVSLDVALADLEGMMAPQLRAKGLHYALDVRARGLHALTDGDRLRQVLTNLITNAVKFTDEGGRVLVVGDAPPAPAGEPATVRITVTDTGRGIPADRLQAIFEPFVQIDRHLTHESQQGVGLGLAISRDLARAMGGELTVASTVGERTTFTLTLPRIDPPSGR